MNENNRQEFIELYLLGELEGQALRDFEEQLKEDTTLQEDVTLSKKVEEALDGVKAEQLFADKISAFGDKYVIEAQALDDKPTKANNQRSNSSRNILIIALLILTGLVVFWITQQQNTPEKIEPEQIFASYYEPYLSNKTNRSGDNIDKDYLSTIEAYDDANYSDAIAGLTQRIVSKPDDIPAQLLLGNSYLNISPPETQKAIELFKSIAASGSDLYSTTASWYLALAYLQARQTEEAKTIFENLSKNDSARYANLAKEILTNWE